VTGIAFLLLAAAAGLWVAHVLGIPAIPLLVVLGMATSALLDLPGDFLEAALVLGVTLVVFVAGIELSPERVGRYRMAAVGVGLLQFTVLGAGAIGAALLLGFGVQAAAYIGLAISASSTLVVVRVLQQRKMLYTALGRTVTGILLLQDLLVILFIPVVTRLPDGAAAVGLGVAGVLALMALAGILLRWVAPWVVPWASEDEEFLLLLVLGILFGFLSLSYFLEVPLVVGAFLAGLALSSFPVNALVRGQLRSLGDFFSAIFFTALGAFLTLPTLDQLVQATILALLLVLLTPPLVALASERFGFPAKAGIGAGLLLAQASEFSLVVGLQGVVAGHLDDGTFAVIALVTVATMILTPELATNRVTNLLMRIHPFGGPTPELEEAAEPPRDHLVIVGCGVSGVRLLETLVGAPYEVWVVDDDPVVVERVREAGFHVIRGDATDLEVLRRAGAHQARLVVSTIRRAEETGPLLALTSDRPTVVRAFEDDDARWVEERGGIAISYSDAALEDFLDWFHGEEGTEPGSGHGAARGDTSAPKADP
jgi:Kef-type K+ transport system membrane component KefB